MIKVVSKKDSIVVIGHADYAFYGKDIVCASASAIVITSINACLKVNIKNNIIIITGHAGYDDFGKDIVCASVSSIVVTSINLCLRFNKESIKYKEEKDKLTIEILSNDDNITLTIENMLMMLEELASTYKKNIKIIKEEI